MEKLSDLVPMAEAKEINVGIWDVHTSYEGKWELLDGVPFGDTGIQRDRLSICLIYSMGLKHLLEVLPDISKQQLFELLKEQQS